MSAEVERDKPEHSWHSRGNFVEGRPRFSDGDKAVLDEAFEKPHLHPSQHDVLGVLEDIAHSVMGTSAQIVSMREEIRQLLHVNGINGGGTISEEARRAAATFDVLDALSHTSSPTGMNGGLWREQSAVSAAAPRAVRIKKEMSNGQLMSDAASGQLTQVASISSAAGPKSERATKGRVSVNEFANANNSATSIDEAGEGGLLNSKLPEDWPSGLELFENYRPYMSITDGNFHMHVQKQRGGSLVSGTSNGDVMHELASFPSPESVRGPWYIIHPSSWFRSLYDVLSLSILFYDLTIVPFILAWDITITGALQAFSYITVSFWTTDILVGLLSGYLKKGVPIMQPRLVAMHYMRTRFATDMMVVICEWLSMGFWLLGTSGTGVDDGTGNLRMLRFAKLSRLLRIMTVLRMLKLVHIIEDLVEAYVSESLRVFMKVARIFVLLLWCNHVLACGWWWVGKHAPTDTGINWVDVEIPTLQDGSTYYDSALGFQYTSAFHWAAAQITLGAVEMNCVNSMERVFNVCSLLVGLLLGATLISSISATMVDYQMARKEQTEKKRLLRRFLRQNDVHPNLAMRVQQQVADRFDEQPRIDYKDVEACKVLAPSLQTELRFAIVKPRVSHHALLRLWISLDVASAQSYVIDTVVTKCYMQKDEIFIGGDKAKAAYFLVNGEVSYMQEPRWAPVEQTVRTQLDSNSEVHSWIVEAALWSHWTHVGTARAESTLELAELDPDAVAKAVSKSGIIMPFAVHYCAGFHMRIISAKPPSAPWPTDLQVPFTDFGDLVLSMPTDMQQVIGFDALDQLATSKTAWNRNNVGFVKLRQEVEKGKSIVVVDGQGNIRRVVAVVALRVERADGCILVQVGRKTAANPPQPSCQLPGGKQDAGEAPDSALERIMEAKMAPLKEHINLDRVERNVEVTPSKDYGVNTKYLRSVYVASLEGDAEDWIAGDWKSVPPSFSHLAVSPTKSLLSATPKKTSSEAIERFNGLEADLSARAVFLAPEPGKPTQNLYAWLSEQEFMLLKGPAEDVLQRWLEALELDAASEVSEDGRANGGAAEPAGDSKGSAACEQAGQSGVNGSSCAEKGEQPESPGTLARQDSPGSSASARLVFDDGPSQVQKQSTNRSDTTFKYYEDL